MLERSYSCIGLRCGYTVWGDIGGGRSLGWPAASRVAQGRDRASWSAVAEGWPPRQGTRSPGQGPFSLISRE